MKKWKDNWPFLWAILLAFPGNVDLFIIPAILQPLDMSFGATFGLTVILANLEIIGWFYFWRWFTWVWLPKTEPIKDTVQLTKSVIDLLKEHGLLGTITYKIKETFKWATSDDRKQSLKKWGHLWTLFWGAEPFFAGGRLLGVISCAATRWRVGLISLCIGNTLHVYISIKTWRLTFYLWDQYEWQFISLFIVVALCWLGKLIYENLKVKEVS